jgi:hypothetical protein
LATVGVCIFCAAASAVALFCFCNQGKVTFPLAISNATNTHVYGEWEITEEATSTADGLKERVCACSEAETETIPATRHSIGEDSDADNWGEFTPVN